MDYEKAYKAVLKTATQWIKDGCTDKERICLESVFPELRESEDERIRKALVIMMKVPRKEIFEAQGITKEQALAYLEKPKEPIDPFDTKLFQDGVKEGRRLEREDIKKEQKPAEWSDEDEKIRRNLMSLLANMRGDRITEETYQKYYPWLKDLCPSWKPSEEQMRVLKQVEDRVAMKSGYWEQVLDSLYLDLIKL